MIVGGIDGGLDGALAFIIEGELMAIESVPTIEIAGARRRPGKKSTARRDFDELALVDILERYKPAHVFYEMAGARSEQSAQSIFMTGQGVGVLRGVLAGLKIPSTKVYSQRWQRIMLHGIAYERGNPKAVKAAALVAAKRLFPTEKWLATERSWVPHDGFVDSALICEWGRRELEGINAIEEIASAPRRRKTG